VIRWIYSCCFGVMRILPSAEHRVFSQTLETHMHFPYAPVSRSTSSTSHQRNASGEKGFADVFCGLPQ
jgi:hypothetical protein